MTFEFRVIQTTLGYLHLFGTHIDYYAPMLAVNKLAGKRVVEMAGTVLGVEGVNFVYRVQKKRKKVRL